MTAVYTRLRGAQAGGIYCVEEYVELLGGGDVPVRWVWCIVTCGLDKILIIVEKVVEQW